MNFYASLPREDYLGFLKYSGDLVGNSSSGLIEGSYFGIPVIITGGDDNAVVMGGNMVGK